MPSSKSSGIAVLGLALGLSLGCGRATGVPDDSIKADGTQAAPFDHDGHFSETPSPHSAMSLGTLREGTPIAIRLLTPVSSASSSTGDTFEGTLDQPIVIAGETAVPRGAGVTGRVLAAKAAGKIHSPGYLRIALIGLTVGGKRLAIETSSLFVKGASDRQRYRSQPGANSFLATDKNEVGFDAERRLTFRLAQPVDLQP